MRRWPCTLQLLQVAGKEDLPDISLLPSQHQLLLSFQQERRWRVNQCTPGMATHPGHTWRQSSPTWRTPTPACSSALGWLLPTIERMWCWCRALHTTTLCPKRVVLVASHHAPHIPHSPHHIQPSKQVPMNLVWCSISEIPLGVMSLS